MTKELEVERTVNTEEVERLVNSLLHPVEVDEYFKTYITLYQHRFDLDFIIEVLKVGKKASQPNGEFVFKSLAECPSSTVIGYLNGDSNHARLPSVFPEPADVHKALELTETDGQKLWILEAVFASSIEAVVDTLQLLHDIKSGKIDGKIPVDLEHIEVKGHA